jgi:hypothetical protein
MGYCSREKRLIAGSLRWTLCQGIEVCSRYSLNYQSTFLATHFTHVGQWLVLKYKSAQLGSASCVPYFSFYSFPLKAAHFSNDHQSEKKYITA